LIERCSPLEIMPGDLVSDEFVVEQLRDRDSLTMSFSDMKHTKIDKKRIENIYWIVVHKVQIDFFTIVIMLFCSITQMIYYFKMTRTDALYIMQRANQE